MENPRPEGEKIIKHINLFRLKKEPNFTEIKDIRNLFRQSVEEYLNKITPYLIDIVNNSQISNTWKTY